MCYSLAGRLQSRLAALAVAALLAALFAWLQGDERYLTMLLVMALLAADLDIAVYSRLITYQTRWHTYLFGAIEFLLMLAVLRWWLAGTLPLGNIIGFYILAWVCGQIAVQAFLPIFDPCWAEHGGEIARPGTGNGEARRRGTGVLLRGWRSVARASENALTLAALTLFVVLEMAFIPSGLQFVGVATAIVGACSTAFIIRKVGGMRSSMTEALALALLLSLLLRGHGPWPYLAAGALAAGARAWPRLGSQQVFNGAALALLLVLLLVPGTYTTTTLWGNSLLLPLVMSNIALLLALSSGTLPLVLAFGLLLLAGRAFDVGSQHAALWSGLELPSLAYLVFFGGFVLADRSTVPRTRVRQAIFGAAVAALGIVLQSAGIGLPFVVALLLCNYAAAVAGMARTLYSTLRGTSVLRISLGLSIVFGGALLLGGSLHRLSTLDPALLSLPPQPALAGGQAIPRFEDVAGASGIVLSHHGDPSEGSPAVGTGAAWGDYDNDGRPDLYVTDHMGAAHLYHNRGDGTFVDVAAHAGVAHPGLHATSATFVDYDNDGWPDLYVGVAFGPNRLYHNNRNGTFTDVTARSGLGDTGRTMSTAWADYDGDGYLDVFVANYPNDAITFDPNSAPTENTKTVLHMPHPRNRLYHNNGNGTFTDVTYLLGDEPTWGFGFSAVWFDYNNDGRPDLYVVYDFGNLRQPNTLWRNDGPGGSHGWRFTQVQTQLGVDTRFNPMGAATGDYNNDGWQDIAVTNIGPNMLYLNHRGRRFTDEARAAGVTDGRSFVSNMLNPSLTWGDSFGDFNNDGWLDLYLAAGAMDYQNVPQPNRLLLNDHHGRFIDVSDASGTADPSQSRSVAVSDYDGDGRLDMFVANYGQPPRLYRNVSPIQGANWLELRLRGTRSNRDAVGARVTLHASGLQPQTQEVQIGQGLGSCNDKTLHFGLGRSKAVQRVEIRWPSGTRQTLGTVEINRVVSIREPGPPSRRGRLVR